MSTSRCLAEDVLGCDDDEVATVFGEVRDFLSGAESVDELVGQREAGIGGLSAQRRQEPTIVVG